MRESWKERVRRDGARHPTTAADSDSDSESEHTQSAECRGRTDSESKSSHPHIRKHWQAHDGCDDSD